MLFALIVIISRKVKVIEDSNQMNLCSRPISILALTFSIIGILGYGIFGTYCPSLSYCNEIHPYVVFIPVSVQYTLCGKNEKDISSNQLFSNFFSKNISFTKFLPKMCFLSVRFSVSVRPIPNIRPVSADIIRPNIRPSWPIGRISEIGENSRFLGIFLSNILNFLLVFTYDW